MPKLYIAGPMTGLPQFNIPAFDAAAAFLRSVEWAGDLADMTIVSPAELDDPVTRATALASPDGAPGTGSSNGETWGDFLARDVRLISDGGITGIVVLPGWERSRGARLETFVGALNRIPILTYHGPVDRVTFEFVPYIDLVKAWANKDDLSFHSPAEQPFWQMMETLG